jgi:hypothetical protein
MTAARTSNHKLCGASRRITVYIGTQVPPLSANSYEISAPGVVHIHFEEEIKGHETGNRHPLFQSCGYITETLSDDSNPTVIGHYKLSATPDKS